MGAIPDFLDLPEEPIAIRPINGVQKVVTPQRTQLAEAISPAANVSNVGWAPFPGGQVQYLSCPVREIFLEGNRGGGKTELLLVRYLAEVGKYGDAWRGIIFRREYKHLEDLIAKSKRLFRKLGVKARWLSSKGDYKWIFEGGEELIFRAMKDPEDYWNYHGHEYPFIAWEELTNYPDDGCYEKMKSCNRCSVPDVPRVYHSTGNPFGAGHGWVKQRFINLGPSGTIYKNPENGMMRVRIHVDLDDNKALLAADPEYIAQLEAIENPALRKAWRDGDWDITVGGFLQGVWDHDIHILQEADLEALGFEGGLPPRDWKRWRALDMGFAAPFSVGWYAKDPENGNIYRYRELYGWGGKPNLGTRQSPDEVAEEIVKIEARERAMGIEFKKNPADTSLWGATSQKVAGREITQAELMREVKDDYGVGVGWIPAKKGPGSRINGAQVVVQALKNAKKGKPAGFYVTHSCRHFIRTVPILMPDPGNWEDVDTDMEDHVWDEWRYSLVSHQRIFKTSAQESNEPVPGTFDWLMKYGNEQEKKASMYRRPH